jgi:hypothetical protein
MAKPCCCRDFIYRLVAVGTHQRCNFLDLEFSSDRSSSSKLSLPCAKRFCHLSTALRPKASSQYACLIMWNVSLADLPNFWQNLLFSLCSNCDILDFPSLAYNYPSQHWLFVWIHRTHANCFILEREKNGQGIISWLHVSAVVNNSSTMRPIHEIIDCTTYNLIVRSIFRRGNDLLPSSRLINRSFVS